MLTEPKLKQSLIVPWHFVVKCFFELTDIPIWTACKWMTFSVQHEIWILEEKKSKRNNNRKIYAKCQSLSFVSLDVQML